MTETERGTVVAASVCTPPEFEAKLAAVVANLRLVCIGGCGTENPTTLHTLGCEDAQRKMREPLQFTPVRDDRVSRTPGALYGEPVKARKRRRCDGHLADERHWIEVGQMVVWSALPPNHPEVCNDRWWHMAFCADCAPAATTEPR